MKYIDLHCDTLLEAFCSGKEDIFQFPEAMVDGERLVKAQAAAQFFAVFLPPRDEKFQKRLGITLPEDEELIRQMQGILQNTLTQYGDKLAFASNGRELAQNETEGRVSAFLTLEDGRAVAGSMDKLEEFYGLGIRLISLTWNFPNCFGFPNSFSKTEMEKGLTSFGKEAVVRMEEMGMLVDVSHLSDGGFWDVAELLKGPFVASHSNSRSLVPHPRNLTDEMLRVLGEKGGVAGLNFCPVFVNQAPDRQNCTLKALVAQVRHMTKVGGIESVALGSDLDGISGTLEVGAPDEMELLFSSLKKEGFLESQVEKIAYGNAKRVIEDGMKG